MICAYESAGGGHKFCSEQFIRPKVGLNLSLIYGLSFFFKAMEEIRKLRAQISSIVQVNFPGTDPEFSPLLSLPSDPQVNLPPFASAMFDLQFQVKVLRQLLTAGFIDQVAVRKDIVDKRYSTGNQYTSSRGVAYKALGVSDDVYIHPSSLLFNAVPPEYLIYQDLVKTSRIYLKGEVASCCSLCTQANRD